MPEAKIVTDTELGLDEEAFNSLEACPQCHGEVVEGSADQLRLDLANVGSMIGGNNLDQRCEADLKVKTCITCGYLAIAIEVVGYAGY